ncbi:MAG: TIGR04282 family arsenosugar biosynthesis glycosyltransferase [Thermodesulfobacteriota bacterium]
MIPGKLHRSILFFVRYPEKGRVKTRLETHLSKGRILSLYKCFVEDILATLKKSGYPVFICFLPENKEVQMKAWLGSVPTYIPQTGEDLGERMSNAFGQAFTKATPPIDQAVLLGSDFPDLDPDILDQAFDSLSRNDVTLGPAVDGGYYLIGFNRRTFFKDVFSGISWGTGQVFTETMKKIEKAGLKVHTLPEWRDIDTFEDLALFYRQARENGLDRLKTVQFLHSILAR